MTTEISVQGWHPWIVSWKRK